MKKLERIIWSVVHSSRLQKIDLFEQENSEKAFLLLFDIFLLFDEVHYAAFLLLPHK